MRLTANITVQTKSTSYDAEGMPIEVWTASQTAEKANKQPLSGEIAFNEYGISDAGVTHLFFMAPNTTARENGRIVDDDDTYDIYRAEYYPNHYEVIVRPVVS